MPLFVSRTTSHYITVKTVPLFDLSRLLSSLWVSRTGSTLDWFALQEALYKCIDTIQYYTLGERVLRRNIYPGMRGNSLLKEFSEATDSASSCSAGKALSSGNHSMIVNWLSHSSSLGS